MKSYWQTFCLSAGLCLAASLAVQAGPPTSPFGVTARMKTGAGTPIIRLDFVVPPGLVLYPDRLHFETADGRVLTPLTIPEPVMHKSEVTGQEKLVYDHSFSAELKLDSALPVNLVVKFQGCSNAACYFPDKRYFTISTPTAVAQTGAPGGPAPAISKSPAVTAAGWQSAAGNFKVAARETGYVSRDNFVGFLQKARTGRAMPEGVMDRFRKLGLPTTLLFILLGGIGLNLTPCVLPLIPINLAIIGAGARASSRGRGFALGAIYGGGMALVYGLLGLVVVLTGSKFGTLNSSVWFNLAIALVFAVMAAAMFDFVNIDFSRFQSGAGTSGKAQKSQFILAFSMGVVAALMAGACVAPVVISVLLLSAHLYGAGMVAGLLLPFLLGLGMALPWPFAGAGLSLLPKPGKWMKWVKYSFGVLILLFAAYYGYLAGNLFLARHSLTVFARTQSATSPPAIPPDESLARGLQEAHAQGRPVFIDFRASWCKNCEAMDAVVFPATEVKQQLKNFVVVRYDAEAPNESPAREVLDYFGVMGLPTYVVLNPNP
ncbi:MAG TPA: thioredoxin family protein [Verrucomicrobiae bacterium]|nr:thioredoxin family protein [Verrucomicrobiae bacterium]